MEASAELKKLARVVADWADRFRAIEAVEIFGSRVRGDHRVDSDLDVWIQVNAEAPDEDLDAWLIERDAWPGLMTLAAATGLVPHWPADDDARIVGRVLREGAVCWTDRKVRCIWFAAA